MHLLSRIRVGILGLAGHVLKFPKPFTFVGPDASLSLVREIIGLGVKRVMVITDRQLFQLGIVNPLIELMKDSKVEVEVFSEIEPDPGLRTGAQGRRTPQKISSPMPCLPWVADHRSMAQKRFCSVMPTTVTHPA